MTLKYGGLPVPYTVSWTSEDSFHIATCRHFHRPGICQEVSPGQGKPMFAKPHSQRQREAMAKYLCDLCGKPLAGRTKVSLSKARTQPHGAEGPCVMQVEPLLHKECAAISLRHCPSLKRDIEYGALFVRQVTKSRPQVAVMSEEYTHSVAGIAIKALGHGKMELIKWIDRDAEWLEVG